MNADYKDLKIWHIGMDLVKDIYNLTGNFPKIEESNMVWQMRRAVASIPGNIAEGASSFFEKNLYSHLSIAYASLKELETFLILSHNFKYIKDKDFVRVREKTDKLGAKLYLMSKQVESRTKRNGIKKLNPTK